MADAAKKLAQLADKILLLLKQSMFNFSRSVALTMTCLRSFPTIAKVLPSTVKRSLYAGIVTNPHEQGLSLGSGVFVSEDSSKVRAR